MNRSALVWVIVWQRISDKPSHEPMMTVHVPFDINESIVKACHATSEAILIKVSDLRNITQIIDGKLKASLMSLTASLVTTCRMHQCFMSYVFIYLQSVFCSSIIVVFYWK